MARKNANLLCIQRGRSAFLFAGLRKHFTLHLKKLRRARFRTADGGIGDFQAIELGLGYGNDFFCVLQCHVGGPFCEGWIG